MTQIKAAKSLAIIGGGQLGLLLCEAARELGIATVIITPDPEAPALLLADKHIITALDEPGLAGRIAAISDAATFEIESVADILLSELEEQQAANKLAVYPDPRVLRLLKNKATQKDWLAQHGFPTLPYLVTANPLLENADFLAHFPTPLVQKAQQGGYDGYGVQVIATDQELDQLWGTPSIIEPFLSGAREIAVLAARSRDGAIATYGAAELEFEAAKNILDAVIAPANISAELHAASTRLASAVVEKLDGVGLFAIEMFINSDNELLINEISPRVHNSGHHTLESCATSQFEQHVRAVAGLPLGPTEQKTASIMKNILCTDSWAHLCTSPPGILPTSQAGTTFYWYGKREPRAGRKMGHITCIDDSRPAAEKQIAISLAELQSTRHEGNT